MKKASSKIKKAVEAAPGPLHAALPRSSRYDPPSLPMPLDGEHSAVRRWLGKPVLASRLLDDMENPSMWRHHGEGAIEFTEERQWCGAKSLRLTSPTKTAGPPPTTGRPFGSAVARREFTGEDWSAFNRISFRVFPHLPGFRVISLLVQLCNEGTEPVPDRYRREGLHHVLLEPDRWNHVVWEIPSLSRDRVAAIELVYRLQGNEPGAATVAQFDFDDLRLERVDADTVEGWEVTPGVIAFSHTGYLIGGTKTAIASRLESDTFELIDAATGSVLHTGEVRRERSRLGEFLVLDFSSWDRRGSFRLKAGSSETRPFRIDPNVWHGTIWKTLNHFACQRCGTAVPGIHDACHLDARGIHGDRSLPVHGGWHDAGDLSQGLVNTAESAHAMLRLAEQVLDSDPVLGRRLIEEARWGLDWMLRTRFGDGYRVTWVTMDFWTDNRPGTQDDIEAEASDDPFENFLAVSTEALASRLLREEDPVLAERSLRAAREDWNFAMERAAKRSSDRLEQWPLELASAAAGAAIELFRAAGEDGYLDSAVRLATAIADSQQRRVPDWRVPLVGFFYRDPSRKRIVHYSHRSHEQAPVVVLTELSGLLPDHPHWMQWYSAVVLYTEYLRAAAELTRPWRLLPGSIYRFDESDDPTHRAQVSNGVELDDGIYLRRFPVWRDFRGNYGAVLSEAMALAAAARLRRDTSLIDLCQRQLEWVVGRNPFSQSTMYGEGYDYAPQYTAMSGDMAGSLPVGIQTKGDGDAPYWPAANCYNYKEVWVHPSARWLGLARFLNGVSMLWGNAEPGHAKKLWINEKTTKRFRNAYLTAGTDEYHARLPWGVYRISYGDQKKVASLLPGETRRVDLWNWIEIVLSTETSGKTVRLEARVRGRGPVRLAVRASNLTIRDPDREIALDGRWESVVWEAITIDAKEPWVAVVVPNGNPEEREEAVGGLPG